MAGFSVGAHVGGEDGNAAQADPEEEWPGLVLATLLSTLRGLESVHAPLQIRLAGAVSRDGAAAGATTRAATVR